MSESGIDSWGVNDAVPKNKAKTDKEELSTLPNLDLKEDDEGRLSLTERPHTESSTPSPTETSDRGLLDALTEAIQSHKE